MAENVIDRAIEGVSDGVPVDWAGLEGDVLNEADRECLRWLRLLGRIEELHRTTPDDLDAAGTVDTTSNRRAPAPQDVVEMWGRYELREMIGEGSFGAVYRAWDPQLESELAIKILHQKTTDARLKANLLAEGRALARIRHPNVVRVIGIESNGDRMGLCMDFVRGQTLDDVMRLQGRMSAEEAVLVGQDVCEALAAVHRAHFVHRDIKAKNVLRENGGRFVLMDFGAGRDERTAAGDLIGTPLYMAPEVLEGSQASPRSDVYSVGVLLFYLVTGEYPIYGRSLDDLRALHKRGDRRFLSEVRTDLPAPFVRAVEHALSPDPNERYQTAAAFLNDLRAILRRKRESLNDQLVRVFYGVYATAGALAIVSALGLLTSTMFNHALGSSSFVDEGMRDWIVWGSKSALLPILIVTVALVVASHLAMLSRILRDRLRHVGFMDALSRRIRRSFGVFRLNDVSTAGEIVLVVTTASVGAATWHFLPLLRACFGPISTAAREDLVLLSPVFSDSSSHLYFRETFTLLALFSAFLWWLLVKFAARRGQRVSRSMLIGGATVTILNIAILSLPYRLLRHNDFNVANWNGFRCYVLGQRQTDALLFCPLAPIPRSHIVPTNDSALQKLTDKPENIFTQLSPSNGLAEGKKP
jgi:tRNA A-37 threonylcarbamoyl transferase component Bud32